MEQSEKLKSIPFAMYRFCSLWRCEAEYELDGNHVYLWERLHHPADIGPDARPRWYYDHVVFYRPAQKDWIHVNRHLMFNRASLSPDVLILPNGICVEVTGAQVVWRGDHWAVRWHGYTHTPAAKLAAAGIEAWKDA